MTDFHTVFILSFVAVIVYVYWTGEHGEVAYVVSTVDNSKYLVRKMEDSTRAADLLATVKSRLVKFCDHMKEKYPKNEDISRLIKRFNPNVITEAGKSGKYTSYSVNKGEKIVLCLRSRDEKEQLEDINTLMFVSLHELSHISCPELNHTNRFWEIFKFFLKEAIAIQIYEYVNYNANNYEYCGISISSTPLKPAELVAK